MNFFEIFKKAWGLIPPFDYAFYAFLSSIIPFTMYKINRWLRQAGDAPWKASEDEGNPEN